MAMLLNCSDNIDVAAYNHPVLVHVHSLPLSSVRKRPKDFQHTHSALVALSPMYKVMRAPILFLVCPVVQLSALP